MDDDEIARREGEFLSELLVTDGGQVLANVHPPGKCAGQVCIVHNPTDHHMRTWPVFWRDDAHLFERMCEHWVGHPDPDQREFWKLHGWEHKGIHGCDGCCRQPHLALET